MNFYWSIFKGRRIYSFQNAAYIIHTVCNIPCHGEHLRSENKFEGISWNVFKTFVQIFSEYFLNLKGLSWLIESSPPLWVVINWQNDPNSQPADLLYYMFNNELSTAMMCIEQIHMNIAIIKYGSSPEDNFATLEHKKSNFTPSLFCHFRTQWRECSLSIAQSNFTNTIIVFIVIKKMISKLKWTCICRGTWAHDTRGLQRVPATNLRVKMWILYEPGS